MSRYSMHRIVWIDLETTGLDPKLDTILEVACIITDGHLDELCSGTWVVKQPRAPRFQPPAYEMHKSSGLLDELKHMERTSPLVDIAADVVIDIEGHHALCAPLGGNSPQFDRGFLREHMPAIDEVLGHRHFDASTLLQVAHTWGLDLDIPPPEHRALPDIRRSIEIARRFRELVS